MAEFGYREKYLLETILPKAIELGRFGRGASLVKCVPSADSKGVDQFASSVLFLKCTVRSPDNIESTHGLVVKFQPDEPDTRNLHNSDVQFYKENIMYSEILPFLDHGNIVDELFPKFLYAFTSRGKDPDNDVVIVQDLSEEKFQLCKEKLFLDYDHVCLILKMLGRFHALSYIAKQQKPKEFDEIKDKLIEHAWNRKETLTEVLLGPCGLRGVFPILKEDPKSEFLNVLRDKLETDVIQLMKDLVTPTELAVICHGDFLRNNVLVRYKDNEPKDIKFFDLQTSRYASPVIDLSLVLFLNTQPELRVEHWDDFIGTYHKSLHETVVSAGCTSPSLADINREFQKKGVYGYMHCSYFLPVCLSGGPPPITELSSFTPQDMVEMFLKIDGERGTRYLAEIIRDLNRLNCIPEV